MLGLEQRPDVAGKRGDMLAREDPARHVAERIPDPRLAPIRLGGTLDLEGCSGDSEGEIAEETRG